MQLLVIEWSIVGVKIAQLLLSLSILVILHEFGHYITARWFGCRVEKFYLFFNPWFSLFKKKIGETEYGIGWLPLGGYVKIAGMIDESMDTEAMKQPAQPHEFRSKPAWQRLIIMLGGIIVNVLLAILIYAMVLSIWGQTKVPLESLKYGVSFQDSIYQQIGFKQGDKILTVDNETVKYLDDATLKIFMAKSAMVERNGEQVNLSFPENLLGKLVESKKTGSIVLLPRVPAIVGEIDEIPKGLSPARDAGLKKDDLILAVNGTAIQLYDEIRPLLQNSSSNQASLVVLRGSDTVTINSKLTSEKKLGLPSISDFERLDKMGLLQIETRKYSYLEAIPAALKLTGEKLNAYISQFKKILNPKTGAYKGLGGFKAIGNAFPGVWNWESFWNMTAFLSIVLAFMNLLPIPALDGGHVMFTLYEIIFRRKPNEKFLEYAQMAGMIFLLALMVYANANDWIGWGK